MNRYSFDDAAGTAGAGTTITDSVGGAHGTIVGLGAAFTGSSLSLPGGGGGSTAAYVDLPNGLLSVHNTVTFEAWYTIGATPQAWGRVWDFGSSAGGEVLGSGGGGEGQDYFLFAPNHGTNINLQRNAVRNLDPLTLGSGTAPTVAGEQNRDGALASVSGQQYHVVSVWEQAGTGGVLTFYRDGVSLGSTNTTFNATDINDVNNWLGRSNWTGDSYFQGEFNEFRIWNEAFDDTQVAASFAAGPSFVIPEPRVFGLIGITGLLLLARRRGRNRRA